MSCPVIAYPNLDGPWHIENERARAVFEFSLGARFLVHGLPFLVATAEVELQHVVHCERDCDADRTSCEYDL